MNLAKQSTARTFLVGPILDADGVAKTDEVVASIKVTKNGTVGAVDAQDTLTHNHTGHYVFVSDGGDFDTLGEVEFSLNSGTNAMQPVKFQVLSAGAYDSLITSYSATRGLAGTALPAAAADAAGGLPISDAGGLDMDTKLANTNEVTAARMGALTDWIDGGRLDLLLDATKAKTDGLNFTGTDVKATLDGEGVALVDDAITASKFDESTAYPLKSADTGDTTVGRKGSGAHTLTTLDTQVLTRHASGAAVAKSPATLAAGDVTGNLPADVKAYTTQPTVTGATLDGAYDAAKTAAQAGDKMDLLDTIMEDA